ncbi:MAG: hypothetical protein KDD73_11805 [Anaerolineales bacterium]|nr:hypothetical protein [Anaerolineales bacterium]
MAIRLALDPALQISAPDFVDAWNRSDYAAQATATPVAASRDSFADPALTVALISAAVSIPASIVATFISDYLKKRFLEEDKQPPPKIEVIVIQLPDGQDPYVAKRLPSGGEEDGA